MKRQSADIFVDVVDNYGDMGWIAECILLSGLDFEWRIISDAPQIVHAFFQKSLPKLSHPKIIEKSLYEYDNSAPIIILSLHAKVELDNFPEGRGIIRINYLTYDPWYRKLHNAEHILSSPHKPIRELIYSPLSDTWWVWHYPKTNASREAWLEKMKLSPLIETKKWILIFCYDESFKNFDSQDLFEDAIIFHIGSEEKRENIYNIPWLARDDFWSLIDLSDISILRGEISSVRWLMSGWPFFWDMYKWLGWWNADESDAFLTFLEANKEYREIHERINSGKRWTLSDILSIETGWSYQKHDEIPDFSETLKKTIDSFGISL